MGRTGLGSLLWAAWLASVGLAACSRPVEDLPIPLELTVTPAVLEVDALAGCERPVTFRITHNQSEPIDVRLERPPGWSGPELVEVPPGAGVDVRLSIRSEVIGRQEARVAVVAGLAAWAMVQVEVSVRDRTWRDEEWIGGRTLGLVIGIGWRAPDYPTYEDLRPPLEAFIEDVTGSLRLRYVATFYAKDLRPHWMADATGEVWIDLEDPASADRIRAAVRQGLAEAEPGLYEANWSAAGDPPAPWPPMMMREDGYPDLWGVLIVPGPDPTPCCAPETQTAPPPFASRASPSMLGCELPSGAVAPPMVDHYRGPGPERSLCGEWLGAHTFVERPTTWTMDCPALDSGRLVYDGRELASDWERREGECTVGYLEPHTRTDNVLIEWEGVLSCE